MSKEKMSPDEKPKKSKAKTIIIVLVVLLVLGGVIGSQGNKDKGDSEAEKNTEETEASADIKKAEPNTSEMVDEILLQAKEDAKNVSEDEADAKWKEAFEYLKAHKENFYENNEVMEKSMYYGSYIYQYVEANSKADNVSELKDSTKAAYDAGYNTVKAIKYVYRGSESKDDDSTQNALSKAKENLEMFK